jgi:hypothetical protein
MKPSKVRRKKCYLCKKNKTEDGFNRNKTTKDGRDRLCRDCCKEKYKEYQRKNSSRETERRRRELYPHKVRATRLIQQMVLSGRLVKEPCFICGDIKVEGHHLFYDHPAKVIWLCKLHHRKFHLLWKEI